MEFDIIFGEGISREGDVIDLAVDMGIVEKAGTWYSYNDARIGQGRENAKEYMKTHPETMKEIEGRIGEQAGIKKGDE